MKVLSALLLAGSLLSLASLEASAQRLPSQSPIENPGGILPYPGTPIPPSGLPTPPSTPWGTTMPPDTIPTPGSAPGTLPPVLGAPPTPGTAPVPGSGTIIERNQQYVQQGQQLLRRPGQIVPTTPVPPR